MGAVVQQVAIVAGVLAACFFGPAVAIAFLVVRKRRARARRRSPIGIDLLRGPGHTLREHSPTRMPFIQRDSALA